MNPNWAHLHMMVNHLPLYAALVGALLLGAALIGKSSALARAGLLACLLAGIGTWAGVFSGHRAEDWVNDKPGVTEESIEEHEESAEGARWVAFPLGVLALVALFWNKGPQRSLQIVLLLLSIVTLVAMARTANLGGEIRHTEIRAGAADPGSEASPAGTATGEEAGEKGEERESGEGH